MRKTFTKVLRRFQEVLAKDSDRQDISCKSEIIEKFDEWVKSKEFCRRDETMQDIAARLDMSRYELSWVSRRIYGDNFPSLRKRLRIREAARILSNHPELPILHVAEMVGIADKTNFRRQFAEETGMSPGEWREAHRK
ncbi:MAG: helix-turn-helix domain-containing protein [Bacteroidales bacterium]|nr:helix-turn-helix domain-containing protein [Bacteroidales bacterium]